MRKHYFLGLAANYPRDERVAHTFKVGREEDFKDLKRYLLRRYNGEKAILTKNGRSALALTLQAYFDKGDSIIINGFTCYAVFEAVKAAGLKPVFADISLENLNFDESTLAALYPSNKKGDDSENSSARNNPSSKIKGIIIQNTLGNPVDIKSIEAFANSHGLTIVEDLAHCAGIKYADGREAGTVGAATVFSFGKEKAIDTVSGGAAVLRHPYKNLIEAPKLRPKLSDHLRARLYPTFGAICRFLSYVHLGGILMRCLIKIHFVERSADNKLDLARRPSKFEAKLALMQIKGLSRVGEKPLREFCFVRDRKKLLKELSQAGYFFNGFWYETPVSPERYYKKTNFNEKDCPNSVYASKHIINMPKYYKRRQLAPARKIIEKYLEEKK